MSLFQKSVEQKYLKQLDSKLLDLKYSEFEAYFGDQEVQANIRNCKEEQFQEGFLRELFVKILGYTLNPVPNFNLTTEYKNIKDSKKADGAIVINEIVKAVIELKGTDTTDLGKVEGQAFGYKNNQPECIYIITSNFEKLRFYIDNAIEHIEFNLFTITRTDFEILYLCLAYDNILKGIPKKIKEESISQEDAITKKLYQDYSLFKRELHQNLVKLNPQFDALTLFRKSQKLLDRFLFLFFAEDRQLLPPNSVRLVLNDWRDLQERDVDIPLYNRFKKYFEYLNAGYKGKRYDVFAYNGGLFKPDDILDKIIIDDELLFKHSLKLAGYDFASEVDVNILGHIFEHSLNELDEIKSQLLWDKLDKSKTKRKKDGIYYTPKYITKYIVENTIGKLCDEKRTELGIVDEEYSRGRKNRKKDLVKNLDSKLTSYRTWLLSLTILDPACGSGAFLNQALDFLIVEHRKIDNLKAQLLGGSIIFSDITTEILEKNIYGVDINEESVEIAKLSLWLRTAQKGRKLNTLSNNIKCGNSIIEDSQFAFDKAFNWQAEFPEIFAKNGFDIVIGNPPYGDYFNLDEKAYLLEKFSESFSGTFDMYIVFYNVALKLLKSRGLLCFITPNTFIDYSQFSSLRRTLKNENSIEKIIGLSKVFEDAIVDNAIILIVKNKCQSHSFKGIVFKHKLTFLDESEIPLLDSLNLDDTGFVLKSAGLVDMKKLTNHQPYKLGDLVKLTQGITTGGNEFFINTESFFDNSNIPKTIIKKTLKGKSINRYKILEDYDYILYSTKSNDENIQEKIAVLLEPFYKKLSEKRETKQGKLPWYCLHWPRDEKDFNEPKILIRQTASHLIGVLDIEKHYPIDTIHTLNVRNQALDKEVLLSFLLGIINSKLFKYLYNWKLDEDGKVYPQVKKVNVEWLPIPDFSNPESLVKKVQVIQGLNRKEEYLRFKFLKYLESNYNSISIYSCLHNWYELEFSDFIIILNNIIQKAGSEKLSKADEIEWMELFEAKKQEVQIVITQINQTDREIDYLVYRLYDLTEEEMKFVESTIY